MGPSADQLGRTSSVQGSCDPINPGASDGIAGGVVRLSDRERRVAQAGGHHVPGDTGLHGEPAVSSAEPVWRHDRDAFQPAQPVNRSTPSAGRRLWVFASVMWNFVPLKLARK